MEVAAIYVPVAEQGKSNYILNIAVLGFDIKTDVKSGENRNRQLTNDFTVLGYKKIPLYKNNSEHAVVTELPEVVQLAPQMGISAWVNKENELTPIQAAGGWLN